MTSGPNSSGEHRDVNLANWESRVPHHVVGYGIDRLLADREALSFVVTFDRPRLGDIAGLDVVHLQCHIGTDTISLARLGGRLTGLDFSPSALAAARDLAARAGLDVDFVEADVDHALAALGPERFDVVYTGIGAINWLPSIERWADVVVALLRPGGRLFMREGHPMLNTLSDPRPDGLLVVEYPYFETPSGTRFSMPKSYVDHEGELAAPTTIEFNHGLGEVVTSLLDRGMTLTQLVEHDSVPWDALGDSMVVGDDEEWRLVDAPERVALTYTLQAAKPA
ncbi:MAG: class I SAM-dependent methyltransferase [Ilumatobacteraceae bacterium]